MIQGILLAYVEVVLLDCSPGLPGYDGMMERCVLCSVIFSPLRQLLRLARPKSKIKTGLLLRDITLFKRNIGTNTGAS